MRATPFQIIFVAALGAVAPAAFAAARPAHTVKPLAHTAVRAPKPVADSVRTSHAHLVKPVRGRGTHEVDDTPVRTRLVHGRHLPVAPEQPVKTRLVHGRRVPVAPETVQAKLAHGRRVVVEPPAPRLLAKAQRPVFVEPEPEAAPELEPIHITHDRKQHFTSEPSEPTADLPGNAPRKATTADFLSVVEPPTAPPAPALVRPLRAVSAAARPAVVAPRVAPIPATIVRLSPTAGVVVGSRVELKPVPMPVLQVAPEPLVSLYDKRGRLIVPPALKGSHEVLVHQNVMADSDGLERIQDDEDLSRMRASKMLVALPENEGIQVDERLPGNRRYSRPWTAAFLTALARAHYARFHTALQVNSAVRTVEFQQRLIRTNGNAAPAEGETASPHLTGQAVDIAKHGLSMTEIAWLRGYLLPLVQEGKVDVEEEFQQACFHISVYKKYMPQPAVRRNIAEGRRTPGAALAIVLPQ